MDVGDGSWWNIAHKTYKSGSVAEVSQFIKTQLNSNSIYFGQLVHSQEYGTIMGLFYTLENGLAVECTKFPSLIKF